ncbi:hypothetical protein JOD43_004478 [Pullulanibacillus pueri]|uniref:Uncharacterized protein n=1 Tax=Pullulanibacillus pueri TaxID=1437324 RepID=A0A8J3A0Q0_9BACL|nr:hypothetical protein [Pullulanibacillus pueri]GGH89117.1 hypothetical protein GCM10007096_42980 [Pullulanibacillus pueri]
MNIILEFLEFLNLAVHIPLLKKVNESDIGRNLKTLKKYQWFQNYLNNEKYKELIKHNKDVRKTIGRFNNHKLNKSSYNIKCQKKIHKVLLNVSYHK